MVSANSTASITPTRDNQGQPQPTKLQPMHHPPQTTTKKNPQRLTIQQKE
jgi:hypothetical protein